VTDHRLAAIVANVFVLGTLAFAALLFAASPDLYLRSVQEDEALEWMTFWVFAISGGLFWDACRRAASPRTLRASWFTLGMGLFCVLVAMEEISWGQRLLGTRPPAYLLEHNFQQELNLHNVVSRELRQAGFLLFVLGYGVALPIALSGRRLGAQGNRLGLLAPPLWLVPAFLVTAVTYHLYPWSHTGEWAELMLGTALLSHAILEARAGRPSAPLTIALAWLLALGLGFATARTSWALTAEAPDRVAAAQIELDALRTDVAAARTRTHCGIHKRIYSVVEAYGQEHLLRGAFGGLQAQGLSEERARFFLDPWNSPYWIRHVCSEDRTRRAIFVYSLGPNRFRDSTPWEIVPDDLGAWISRPDPITAR